MAEAAGGNAFITQVDCDPKNMKVQDLFQAFQTNYRSSNQPMLQEPKQLKVLNQLIQRQPDIKADSLLVRHPKGDANEY